MAKKTEQKLAETLYIDDGLTAKEIAFKLKVSEKSVGDWVQKGNWKERRLAKQTAPETFLKKYDDLLGALLDKRLKMERETLKTDQQKEDYRGIIDEMSKLSAIREKLVNDGKISLGTHVRCIERFMTALNKHDVKLFMQLIDFNKEYFTQLAEDLK